MTGSIIRGQILVTQTKDFMASELVVGIHGSEQTYFTANSNQEKSAIFSGKRPFLYTSFPVKTYADSVSPVGDQEFSFEFRTPEWLPDSTIYTAPHANSIFNIRYGIFAQMIPTNSKDFIDQNKTISVFRGSKDIYLYQKFKTDLREINF